MAERADTLFLLPAMSSLYTALHVTPRKKRAIAEDSDDDDLFTPKKMRMAYVSVLYTCLEYMTISDARGVVPQRPLLHRRVGR